MLDIASTKTVTAEEFEQFIYSPENIDRNFELINGKIVDTLSSPHASSIAVKNCDVFRGVYLEK